jgi:hypothetical protein
MPYDISKTKNGGYNIKTKATGQVVHASSEKNLRGVLWHKEHGDSGKHVHEHTVKK